MEDCTVHYYTVLGMNFKTWGMSITEGICAVVKAYYEKQETEQETKLGTVKIKQD